MEPRIAPIANKATTQEASSKVKCTEYSVLLLCISIGKDGEAQPTNWPNDSEPKFPSKIIHFKKSYYINIIDYFECHVCN